MTKNILIYDVAVMPKQHTVKGIVREYEEKGVVLWCSAASGNYSGRNLEGNKPTVISRETLEEVDGIKFIDISKEENEPQ